MNYSSIVFFVFLALFFFGLKFISSNKFRLIYIATASSIFYGWVDYRFLIIFVLGSIINYGGGRFIQIYSSKKKMIFWLLVVSNLSILIFFKYSIGIINKNIYALKSANLGASLLIDESTLMGFVPIGLSFYVLQIISYLTDIYKNRLEPASNFLHFYLYMILFPRVIAGPIERGKDLLPQIKNLKPSTEEKSWEGTKLIIYGYFAKVVLADNLASYVNVSFADSTKLDNSPLYWWVIITAFAFQIYYDFWGYTNIARGLGKWMGLDFSKNFNHPYLATSFNEFWNRWHMSLSFWLRDYIFFPLSRLFTIKGRQYFVIWITMLVSALWHGVGWTFVIWGGLHAFYISLERLTNNFNGLKNLKWGELISRIIVLIQVWVSWVFFRAKDVDQGWQIVSSMFDFSEPSINNIYLTISESGLTIGLLVLLLISLIPEIIHYFKLKTGKDLNEVAFSTEKSRNNFELVFLAALMVISVFLRGPGNEFIYVEF